MDGVMRSPTATAIDAPVLAIKDAFKIYREGQVETVALRGVSLTIEAGELVAIVGPSGSGKSTLLNLIGGLDTPSAGQVWIERPEYRRAARSGSRATAAPAAWLRLSGLQLASIHDRHRKCGIRPLFCRHETRCFDGGRTTHGSWLGGPARSSSGGALRRRTAARGDCLCAGKSTCVTAGR